MNYDSWVASRLLEVLSGSPTGEHFYLLENTRVGSIFWRCRLAKAANVVPAIGGLLPGQALCACGRWGGSKTKGVIMVVSDVGFRWGRMREVV